MPLAIHLVHKFGCSKVVHTQNTASGSSAPVSGAGEPAALTGDASAAWIRRFDATVGGATLAAGAATLSGLRFAVKDNIDVAAVPTTAACPDFAYTPAAHAEVVRRLLQAGALLVGKTNLDQFACGLNGTRSPYGAVPNAFDARYVSGGSSAGSAHVVASGQVDFALGTDTAGSGRVPAGLQNIVGLKPSKGLISTRGVLPAAQSVDVVSIFACTVPMALRVLAAAIGHDPQDPYSRALPLRAAPFGAKFRFGVPSQLEFYGDVLSRAAFEQAVTRMESLGGTAVRFDYEPFARAAALLYESALVAERYAAIRHFFDSHPGSVMEPVRGIIARGQDYGAADVFEAQRQLRAISQQVDPLWCDIDLMLLPTAPTHYTIAQMQADPVALNRNLGTYTNFVNLLDYAALSVPSSLRADGLPFGVTLIGPCGSDWALAELGQRYHQASAQAHGLRLGATAQAMPPAEALPPVPLDTREQRVQVVVVGAHLSGMPLNGQLTERGARLLRSTETAPHYRLYALAGTVPPKPGLVRVAPLEGAAIAVEVWDIPVSQYGSFVALIPPPLGIGTLVLADGSPVQGFVCEGEGLRDAQDITHLGGWRAYMRERAAASLA